MHAVCLNLVVEKCKKRGFVFFVIYTYIVNHIQIVAAYIQIFTRNTGRKK